MIKSFPNCSRAGVARTVRLAPYLFFILTLIFLDCGCASYLARKRLEGVAKGWCETIRASQVIPVYPLTEDLVPGDVFLVQTTIASQAKLYEQKGFLALDDHRTRLKGIVYSNMYFDGYFKDEFGNTPHSISNLAGAGAITNVNATNARLSSVVAPRAAFPTYNFSATSGTGLSLAIPIHGVPVGLNFLNTDKVNGSVTIADSKTYAADEQQLYKHLQNWTEKDEVRSMLSETVRKSDGNPIYLRVVSRVYLTGSVIVSLNNASSTGAGLKAGNAPKISLMDTNGNLNTNYQGILNALNAQGSNVTSMADAGGAVQYVGISDSSVSLAEAFDRPLVVGYLGFDVPVYNGGAIGMPVPTFQRLNGRIATQPDQVGDLTIEQAEARVNLAALDGLAKSDPTKAAKVIHYILRHLFVVEFRDTRREYSKMNAAKTPEDKQAAFIKLLQVFKVNSAAFLSIGGSTGETYARYQEVFALAYNKQ